MRGLSQTNDVYVNLKQRIVAVELKEGQTVSEITVKDLIKDLIKDAGYDVTAIEVTEHPVAHIKAEIEAKQGDK